MFPTEIGSMCLIVFAWRPGHEVPLLLAANRDEFYARPSLPLGHWDDQPGVYAGRDLQAGGTWLGLGPDGRFAALTNIRDPRQAIGPRSRGELPARYLTSTLAPAEFLAQLAPQASEFSGFNLLLGNDKELWHYNPRSGAPRPLPAGVRVTPVVSHAADARPLAVSTVRVKLSSPGSIPIRIASS